MISSKNDITDFNDIKKLVDAFYAKVNLDPLLSPVFNEEAGINWETHLPKMYGFWNSVLFGEKTYKGQPFPKHLALSIGSKHFQRWLELFTETLKELFEGSKATEAKARASSIGQIFQFKMKTLKADFV